MTKAYKTFFAITNKRRDCPFEVALRSRQIDEARRRLVLVEACLTELRRHEALERSPFQPGDQVLVAHRHYGIDYPSHRYLIIDLEVSPRGKLAYVAWEVTKRGVPHQGRYPIQITPRAGVRIERVDEPLDDEASRYVERYRSDALRSLEQAQEGDLRMFEILKSPMGTYSTRRVRS